MDMAYNSNVIDLADLHEIFYILLKNFHGRAELHKLKDQACIYFPNYSFLDILFWFDNYEPAKFWFRVFRHKTEIEKSMIVAVETRLSLCYHYAETGFCNNKICHLVHICVNFLENKCFGNDCSSSHDVFDQHNSKIMSELDITSYTPDEILTILHSSVIKACIKHNTDEGCPLMKTDSCPDIHVCKNYLRDRCSRKRCKFGHNVMTEPCKKVLAVYNRDLEQFNKVQIEKSIFVLSRPGEVETSQIEQKEDIEDIEDAYDNRNNSQEESNRTRQVVSNSKYFQGNKRNQRYIQHEYDSVDIFGVFDILLKVFNGRAKIHMLIDEASMYFERFTLEESLQWFLQYKPAIERFGVFQNSQNMENSIVVAIDSRFQVCYQYLHGGFDRGCTNTSCKFVHICIGFLGNNCFRQNCWYSHNILDNHNIMIVSKLDLGSYKPNEILALLHSSSIKICPEYNSNKGCPLTATGSCPDLHICNDYIRRKCHSKRCKFDHDVQNLSQGNEILQMYKLDQRSRIEIEQNVLVLPKRTATEKPPQNSCHYQGLHSSLNNPTALTDNYVCDPQQIKETEFRDFSKSSRPYCGDKVSRMEPSRKPFGGYDIDANEFFKILLHQYHGKSKISEIRDSLYDKFFLMTTDNILDWFKNHKPAQELFCLFPNKSSPQDSVVIAFKKGLKLCFAYQNGKCQQQRCKCVHLCRNYVSDVCTKQEGTCRYSHNTNDKHNEAVFTKNGLIGHSIFGEEQCRIDLLRCVSLKLCASYITDNTHCENMSNGGCLDLHICKKYLRGICFNDDMECKFGHNLRSPHNLKLLKVLQMDLLNVHIIGKIILLPFTQQEFNMDSADVHISEANVPICEKYLRNQCQKGKSCMNHHYIKPYIWQVGLNGRWIVLDGRNSQSEEIERKFTKPELKMATVSTKEAELPSFMFINFMTMTWEEICKSGNVPLSMKDGDIRRLSTRSYMDKCNEQCTDNFSTRWVWYWMDEDNLWQCYGGEGPPYQDVIEAKYLHGDPSVYFEIQENTYLLNFTNMTQTNLKYNTVRTVRRRPLFLDNTGGVSDFKVDPAKNINIDYMKLPFGWSPIDTSQNAAEKIELDRNSSDFTATKDEFFKTVDEDKFDIEKIFRIQNLTLWSAFCSKKSHMLDKYSIDSTVITKQLFHGTGDPVTVECIIQQGFDHRMHGKNATMYGRGAYFAVKSSYSERYTGSGSQKYMFFAKVLTGKIVQGNSTMQRPPPVNPSKPMGDLYDTCVDSVHSPSIYVIFENGQSYPEFLIQYKRRDVQHTCKAVQIPSAPAIHKIKNKKQLQSGLKRVKMTSDLQFGTLNTVPVSSTISLNNSQQNVYKGPTRMFHKDNLDFPKSPVQGSTGSIPSNKVSDSTDSQSTVAQVGISSQGYDKVKPISLTNVTNVKTKCTFTNLAATCKATSRPTIVATKSTACSSNVTSKATSDLTNVPRRYTDTTLCATHNATIGLTSETNKHTSTSLFDSSMEDWILINTSTSSGILPEQSRASQVPNRPIDSQRQSQTNESSLQTHTNHNQIGSTSRTPDRKTELASEASEFKYVGQKESSKKTKPKKDKDCIIL